MKCFYVNLSSCNGYFYFTTKVVNKPEIKSINSLINNGTRSPLDHDHREQRTQCVYLLKVVQNKRKLGVYVGVLFQINAEYVTCIPGKYRLIYKIRKPWILDPGS